MFRILFLADTNNEIDEWLSKNPLVLGGIALVAGIAPISAATYTRAGWLLHMAGFELLLERR